MKKMLKTGGIILGLFFLAVLSEWVHAENRVCLTCDAVAAGSAFGIRIEYKDGTARDTCSLNCAGAMLAAYRQKDVKTLLVREHGTGRLIDAKKAFWVANPDDGGMEAFSERSAADAFSEARGPVRGGVKGFREAMSAVFSAMYDGVRKVRPLPDDRISDDIARHPECVYCGMDRKKYAHSRVLLRYNDRSEAGLCSVHCAGLDLALHPEKTPARILVGAYDTGNLVDAGKASWVLGGSKQGVMSIRGKWAFEKEEAARAYMRDFGGGTAVFRDIMIAAFEDMWEIIR